MHEQLAVERREDTRSVAVTDVLEQPAICLEVAGCAGSLRALACLARPIWKVAVELQPLFRTPFLYVLAAGLKSGCAGVRLQVGTGHCRMLPPLSRNAGDTQTVNDSRFAECIKGDTEPPASVTAVDLDGCLCVIIDTMNGQCREYALKVYDPQQNVWQDCSLQQRGELQHVVASGKWLYIFSKVQSEWGEISLHLERYNPWTDERQLLPAVPTARCRSAAAALEGSIYSIGGYAFNSSADKGHLIPLGTVECYDPLQNIWKDVAPLCVPRFMCKAIAAGGSIYAVAGSFDQAASYFVDGQPSVERYDPAVGTWSLVASMPLKRCTVDVMEYRGSIFAFGGLSAEGMPTSAVERYDPSTGTWRVLPEADPKGRSGSRYQFVMASCYSGVYTAFTQENWWKTDLVIQRYNEEARSRSASRPLCRLSMGSGHLCAAMVMAKE